MKGSRFARLQMCPSLLEAQGFVNKFKVDLSRLVLDREGRVVAVMETSRDGVAGIGVWLGPDNPL